MQPAARVGDSISEGGSVTSGSSDVFINSIPAAIANTSQGSCSIHGSVSVTQGSGTVFINSQPAARLSDSVSCGATISAGSGNVLIGG